MTDDNTADSNPEKPADLDRIAKVIARAGVASRRDAERMVIEGRVTVNGEKIASPALDVRPSDRITVDGKALEEPQETRLWMYYKPVGLVTSEADEKGRQTVFDALPRDLPRVMTVGRLDLNSEGLLLLTNDGDLKRRLELPSTGWLRRYRVRVNGNPTDLTFDPLRRGITIDGEDFQPMEVRLDSQQGANAWLTVGIREGRNREIRRAMTHIGLQVNRLIRIGYGPFKLTGMEENEVREVKRKVLRDQLGGLLTGEVEDDKPRAFRARGTEDDARRPRREDGPARPRREDGPARPRRDDGPARPRAFDDDRKPRFDKPRFDKGDGPRKPFARREDGRDARGDDARPARPVREDGERKPRWSSKGAPRSGDDRGGERRDGAKPYAKRDDDRKPYAKRDGGKPYAKRDGDKPYAKRDGDKPYAKRDGDKPGGPRRSTGFAPRGEGAGPRDEAYKPRGEGFKPRSEGFKSRGDAGKPRAGGFKSHGEGGKPRGEGFKPRGDGFAPRAEGGKPRSEGFKPRGEGFKPRSEGFKPGGPRKGGFSGGAPAGNGRPGGAGGGAGKGPRPGGGKPRGGPRG